MLLYNWKERRIIRFFGLETRWFLNFCDLLFYLLWETNIILLPNAAALAEKKDIFVSFWGTYLKDSKSIVASSDALILFHYGDSSGDTVPLSVYLN